MKTKPSRLIAVLFCLSVVFSCQPSKQFTPRDIAIVPQPAQLALHEGSFNFSGKTKFLVENEEQASIAHQLCTKFKTAANFQPKVKIGESEGKNTIRFATNPAIAPEGYSLDVTGNSISIQASQPAGFFYAIQTIRQLLPVEIESKELVKDIDWLIPALSIQDEPRFKWRGFMQDVSRHFMPKEYILEIIDYLAMNKMNTFHWHLVDDQGWRLEIKKYPKLTQVGAWRVDHEDKDWSARPRQKPGEKATYGGFYTQDDIREVVEYAQQRYITIVPEIEMPAHISCALAAYPELSCTGGPFTVPSGDVWPITDIYCAGNEKTFQFLEDVISEVVTLFPSPFIHIGGDEADKTEWKKCKKCQARIRKEHLKNEHELQSYFVKRMEKFINSKGRRLIGWDEILEGGLAPQATVMSWRGYKGGIEAAAQGHDVVMSPNSHCYFDHYQGPQDLEPLAWGGYSPLSKVYAFDPIHESMDENTAAHVLGGQANLWCEFVPGPKHAQYMTFPRLAALSEAVWTPKEKKDWKNFSHRMISQLKRYDFLDINYSKSAYLVSCQTQYNTTDKLVELKLSTELPDLKIRYSLNGEEPTAASKEYTSPIQLAQSVEVKAASFQDGKRVGKVVTHKLKIHKATGKRVDYQIPNNKKYNGSGTINLVNSVRGSSNFGDGNWQGWYGEDMEVTLNLEESTPLQKITVGALQKAGSWIFLPKNISFYSSQDGKTFEELGEVMHHTDPITGGTIKHDFVLNAKDKKAKYIKVIAHALKKCPRHHAGEGKKCWMFIDEIEIE
ncbi:MAG: family 20 glycosylhydrolase [Marinifilaceae bacterium]